MKRFPTIFTERSHEPSWNVVQAATLLHEAKSRQCTSFIIYSALEMRMAIEQLIFTIIVVAKGGVDAETFRECKKKDGLFRVLDEASPKYTLKCRFCNVLSSFYPEIPQVAEWDVKSLKKHFLALSDLCHSQLVVQGMAAAPQKWEEKIGLLEEVYEFLAVGMKKGTGILSFDGANAHAVDLWEKYSSGKISLQDVRERFALIKPVLESRRTRR